MDTELKKFVESDISEDFGLTVDTIAQNCKTYGRFKAWCNSDLTKVKQVLNTVKNNGVSAAFFAAYERGEGYNSKWGWLNHTRPKGDYIEDAKSVSDWIKRQSNIMTSKPSWIDAGHPQFDPVPESVKQEGNDHFKSLKKGSIGRVVIAGTAAATWETYYPPALKKELNKVQDYGTPLKWMKDAIISWGGTLDTEGGGDEPDPPGPDEPDEPDKPDEPDEPPEPPEDPEVNNLKDFFGTKLKFIYSNNTNRYFLNKYMNIKKQ